MQHALTVDLGGTKTSLAVGTLSGRLAAKEVLATPRRGIARFLKALPKRLEALARRAGAWRTVRGVGVAVAGLLAPGGVRLLKCPNVPELEGLRLDSLLRFRRRLPLYVENDANAAAWGEKMFGAARRVSHFIYITVSTGIGGGLVLDGKLYRGVYGAGEVGHTLMAPGGPRCACGLTGCLEAVASGTAIARRAREAMRHDRRTLLHRVVAHKNAPTAQEVELAARRGDRIARSILAGAGQFLGLAIGSLLNLLHLELVVLGGGVSRSPALYWDAVRGAAKQASWRETFSSARIVPSKLGDAVGDLGAVALVASPPP